MYRNAPIRAGYEIIRQIAALMHNNYFYWTNSIDGVLQRVGFDQGKVRELHGNIHRVQCTNYTIALTAMEHGMPGWNESRSSYLSSRRSVTTFAINVVLCLVRISGSALTPSTSIGKPQHQFQVLILIG